jgi:hypothetical protein
MKIFSVLFPFLAFCSKCELTLDNLIYSYEKVKHLYLLQLKYSLFNLQFVNSHNRMEKFLKLHYQNSPIELLRKVEENHNLRLANFVIGCLTTFSDPYDFWNKHLNTNAISNFFESSKDLMRLLVITEDWAFSKKILSLLLSIQRQYLHLFGSGIKFKKELKRIEKYEFICERFDPGNSDTLLHLYHHLQLSAIKNKGIIPNDLSVSKSLTLLKIYAFHFRQFDWKKLDEFSILPAKLLFIIIYPSFRKDIFLFLYDANIYKSTFFFHDLIFNDLIWAYESKCHSALNSPPTALHSSPQLLQFMQDCIESKVIGCNLGAKDFWLIKITLYIVSILQT